jgi:hypothetical protein
MDVSTIAALATDMTQTRTANAVQLSVLRKALDVEAQGAMLLIQAAAQVIPTNPPHVGNAVDTFA